MEGEVVCRNAKVAPELLALFRTYMASYLEGFDAELVDFATRYIVSGALDGPPDRYKGVSGSGGEWAGPLCAFFAANNIADPAFYVRFGKFLRFMKQRRSHAQEENGEWLVQQLDADVPPQISRDEPFRIVMRYAVIGQQPDAVILQRSLIEAGCASWDILGHLVDEPSLCRLRRSDEVIDEGWEAFEALLAPGSAHQSEAVAYLGFSGLGTSHRRDWFLPHLLSPDPQLRQAARDAPGCDRAVIIDYVDSRLAAGIPAERMAAAGYLRALIKEAAVPSLQRQASAEADPEVRGYLRELLDEEALIAEAVAAQPALELPPFPCVDMEATVPATLREGIMASLAAIHGGMSRERHLRESDFPTAEDLDLLLRCMDGDEPKTWSFESRLRLNRALERDGGILRSFTGHPDMPLACFLRARKIAFASSPILAVEGRSGLLEDPNRRFIVSHDLDLRTLADAYAKCGTSPKDVGDVVLNPIFGGLPLQPRRLIWPYFVEHLDQLEAALAPQEDPKPYIYHRALAVVGAMPTIPPRLVPRLLELALHGHSDWRPRAQALLGPLPGMRERVETALRHGDAEMRMRAAGWLCTMAKPESVPALRAAYAKEKTDTARMVLVEALKACGHDISEFSGLAIQQRDAEKLLAKDGLKPLRWLPLDSLPSLRLADGGGLVPPVVVQGWLAMAVKAKSAGGTAMLKLWTGVAAAADRPALARFLLTAWLAQERVDAQAAAAASADWDYRREHDFRPKPTDRHAMTCRGILGVAAVCGDETLVPLARPALKAFDGSKRHQIIALLEMLAAIDHPAAIQAVLAFATRHSARSVRESAQGLVQSIAGAKGWSVEDLADRTVPTGGLEDDCTLTLDFGPRSFTLTLGDDLSLVLRGGDGKALKSLPEPRSGDDPDKAAAAKAALATAKKELKALLPQQSARLYEALCLEKSWPAEDWQRYIAPHPILGRMVQRLVWCTDTGTLFRPLADGSLTDADDQAVTLPADARVNLAHAITAGAAAAAAWLQHFKDYEVKPLFSQFGRPVPELTPGQTGFAEAVGVMLTSLKLRGIATKLGYERGPSQDGGWYHNFVRSYPSLGLQASLMFSGCGHGGEDHPVALKEAGFLCAGDAYPRAENYVPLETVPKPLAAELYADLMAAAAVGRFDPEWDRKVQA